MRPSFSPTGAGFFVVEKKYKTLCPFIDYRGLITLKKHYPLPLISSDLRNAYHLVRIREGDGWKTAFNMASGYYRYLVMLLIITNASAVFQAKVNDVLRDMLNHFVFVYLNDIYSWSAQEYILHVRQVLQRLLENQLFVSLLGYVIAAGSVQMDPDKVRVDWP